MLDKLTWLEWVGLAVIFVPYCTALPAVMIATVRARDREFRERWRRPPPREVPHHG